MTTIPSHGDDLEALYVEAETGALRGSEGRPCVVMAHGLAATVDCGLPGFARALAGSGLDVLAFDYRGFGASGGRDRQEVAPARQQEDYHAAIAYARGLADVDPARIILWGVSFSGGHVFEVAADDGRIAAVVSLTPAPDGLAAVRQILHAEGLRHLLGLTALGLRDQLAALRGGQVLAPAIGRPGELAALTAPGALEGMQAAAGPTWRNELRARLFLTVSTYRPGGRAGELRCPVLVQICDDDHSAPPDAAARAALRARAEVRHYDGDHFDVFPGARLHERVARDQVTFLLRHLAAEPAGAYRS